MKPVLTIENSFSIFSENTPDDILNKVQSLLTYKIDIGAEKNALLGKLSYAKRTGNKKLYNSSLFQLKELEKSEIVCWFKDNSFPTGHLNLVLDLLQNLNIQINIKDTRSKPKNTILIPFKNKPHTPRYYQKEMIEKGIETSRGVFESCVGSGKSLIMLYLIKEISVKSLIIVPSKGLLEQLYQEFAPIFGVNKVQMLDSDQVRKGKSLKDIRIITIQSLASLQKKGELSHLVSDIDALFIDEFHHAASESFTNLLPEINHIYYRFGFSGTFLRNDGRTLDMWGFLSNRLYHYPPFKAIQEGFLTPMELRIYDLWGRSSKQYQKEYDMNYCGGQEILDQIISIINSIKLGEQVLILVNKKDKSGKIISDFLDLQGYSNIFVSGDDKKEFVSKKIQEFNDKKISILIGSSVLGEGIDIRSTDHLIMCQGGKSEIVVVQALGRVVRKFEGKEMAIVHDFNFVNTNYLSKHFEKRLEIYEKTFKPEIFRVK
ncbi:MAG: UvrABC system protein B [Candidatus Omnitrophica bacterium]|nr:UvrABC system protein B [Candidatus Omnitrophota bacterium]